MPKITLPETHNYLNTIHTQKVEVAGTLQKYLQTCMALN